MKNKKLLFIALSAFLLISILAFAKENLNDKALEQRNVKSVKLACCSSNLKEKSTSIAEPKGCVFKTVFESEYNDSDFMLKTPENVASSIESALKWIVKEQLPDGGWSANTGSFSAIKNSDRSKIQSDPATTAMVSMALLRCGSTPVDGIYMENLKKSTEFLILSVETSKTDELNITSIKGTQPQYKLGQNIDVMLTSQYFSNVLSIYANDQPKSDQIKKCIATCVSKIQKSQNQNGSFSGSGWAGVLQSSFANNALESAIVSGVTVDSVVLDNSRNYQKKNFDTESKKVVTNDGAGIMLYSLSSSGRGSAVDANKAKEKIRKAKADGKLSENAEINEVNLEKAGMSKSEAIKYTTAYKVNTQASNMAQQEDVMLGFGNNGGEEFISFLQTGEGLVISKDIAWKKWFNNVSGKLIKIQTQDGSWKGHHCITSPVFCTATCLLILSINNDIKNLMAIAH